MTNCSGRAIADVSADADPSTGLAVYAPATRNSSGWAQYGGRSLFSPIVASVYALSGNTAGDANTIPYAHASALFDVTSGSNGTCTYWCTDKPGWDVPTGLGTRTGRAASDRSTRATSAGPIGGMPVGPASWVCRRPSGVPLRPDVVAGGSRPKAGCRCRSSGLPLKCGRRQAGIPTQRSRGGGS